MYIYCHALHCITVLLQILSLAVVSAQADLFCGTAKD